MRRAAAALLLACAAHAIGAGRASATEGDAAARLPARVIVRRSGCARPPVEEEALARLLRVELAEDGVQSLGLADGEGAPEEASSAAPEAIVSLLKACSGETLTVVVASSLGGSAERPVNLEPVQADLRERALAMVIAELLRARWAEIAAASAVTAAPKRKAKAPSSAPPAALSPALADAPLPGPRGAPTPGYMRAPALLFVGVEWRFLAHRDVALTGARVGLSIPARYRWLPRLALEGGVFYDGDDGAAHEIGLWLFAGSVGASLGYSWGDAEMGIGPRIDVGWAHASYRARTEDAEELHAGGFVLVASAIASGRARLSSRLWIVLDIEIGHVPQGLQARFEERSPMDLGGAVAGGRLALALALE